MSNMVSSAAEGVHGDQLIDARRLDETRDRLRADGLAGRAATILTCVTEVRHHRRDASRAGALARVGEQHEFNQVFINRRARGLHDEHVFTSLRAAELDVQLTVGEPFETAFLCDDAEHAGDSGEQRRSGGAADQPWTHRYSAPRA